MKPIKILYVSFQFPPICAAASFRALKITNNLLKHGIKSIVVTKNVEMEKYVHRTPDFSLLKEIEGKNTVLRARYFSPSLFQVPILLLRQFMGLFKRGRGGNKSRPSHVTPITRDPLIPDHYVEWFPTAFWKALTSKEAKAVDVIYATGPPFTVFLIGYLLKARFKKPLVLEYRDPWTDDPYWKKFAVKEWINKFLEKLFLLKADAVLTISEPLKEQIIKNFGIEAHAGKFWPVPSAFDPDDFASIETSRPQKDDFTISLTTSFVGHRDPHLLFNIISKLKKNGELDGLNFSLNIYGNNVAEIYGKSLEKLGIKDLIHFKGFVPHEECLSVLKSSTLNLDLSEKDIDYPSFPFHVWEYIGSGKKFLFLGKLGSYKANYIEKHDLGYVLPLDETKLLYSRFVKVIRDYKTGALQTDIKPENIKEQTWEARVALISKIIKRLVKN